MTTSIGSFVECTRWRAATGEARRRGAGFRSWALRLETSTQTIETAIGSI
jgi:hypothetical protein